MSDQSQGPGWWVASDGNWYPPESHPDFRPPPPPTSRPTDTPPSSAPLGGWSAPASTPPSSPPKRGATRRLLVLVATAVVVAAGAAFALTRDGSDSPTQTADSTTQEITGEFVLTDAGVSGGAALCNGTGGFDDFGPGMNVTIRNGDGELVATTRTLSISGFANETGQNAGVLLAPYETNTRFNVVCPVMWHAEVPGDERFYVIEIGSRGEQTYSNPEMVEKGWHVSFTLG